MTLTPRENILRVLKGEPPGWIPIQGWIDPYNHPSIKGMDPALAKKMESMQWNDESGIVFSRFLGLDIINNAPGLRSRHHKIKVNTQNDAQGRVISIVQTPKGDLRSIQQYSADTGMYYTMEHQVKDRDDLLRMAYVYEDIEYYFLPEDREAQRTRRLLIGDGGTLTSCTCSTPLGAMIRGLAGVETTAYLWADARPEMHDLFKIMEESNRRALDLVLTVDNDAINVVDDTSTTTISPDMFEEFCMGYTDRMAEAVHAAGKFYFHHSCGLIRDLLPLYRQTKMDAVHFFTFPPIGNVTVAEGRRLLGPNITIMAGLTAICLQVSSGKRTEAAMNIQTLFREADPGNRFILILAAEPCNTMEEITFIVQECRKYQRMYSENSKI